MERPVERRAFLGALPGLLALAARSARGQDAPPGVWCGAVTASGATVKVLADGTGVPVELELTDGASRPVRRAQPTDAHGVATFVLDGLRERTRYRYAVTAPGRPALEGRLRTFGEGPFSFRAVFASWAATGSASPVFDAMREQEPDLFVHMGDLHYEDIGRNDVARFQRAYLAVHGPEVAKNGQYGVMDVQDDGVRVRVRLQGMQGRAEVPGLRLDLVV